MTALLDTMEDERDLGLVRRHQAGDVAAFSELYALHYGRLVRFCRRLVRDSHVAEELAQDAFLRAYTAMDRLQGDRRFYPWLTVIARRLVIDHVRRDARVEPHADLEPAAAGAAEDVVVRRFEGGQLLTALDRVRDRHRLVLHLRDWEGLSYEAIAERLGLAPTAIPPLLHRARAALRREYMLVTEGRVAALAPFGLLAAMRRIRDRASVWTAWLPEPSAMSAPVAGVVLSLSTLAASLGLPFGVSQAAPHESPAAETRPAEQAAAADLHAPATHMSPSTSATGDPTAPRPIIVPGVAAGSVTDPDPDGVRRVSQEGRRKPIFVDTQYIGVSADPEEERRRLDGAIQHTAP